MIYCLTGKLLEKAPDYAVVSCGGVGYLAAIPSTTAGALPAVGDTCTLYTCMNVTENDVSLFGFADKESQTMFRLLTGVSGVGPKVGLAILSELSPEQVAMAAASGDSKLLTRASGVGAKLAQRIVLELKDKVKKMGGGVLEGFAPAGGVPSAAGNAANAVSALSVLGYTPTDAASVVAKFDSSLPTEELIRLALKEFGKNR